MAVINIITIAMFVISCSITSFTVLYMLENDRLNKLVPKSVFVICYLYKSVVQLFMPTIVQIRESCLQFVVWNKEYEYK